MWMSVPLTLHPAPSTAPTPLALSTVPASRATPRLGKTPPSVRMRTSVQAPLATPAKAHAPTCLAPSTAAAWQAGHWALMGSPASQTLHPQYHWLGSCQRMSQPGSGIPCLLPPCLQPPCPPPPRLKMCPLPAGALTASPQGYSPQGGPPCPLKSLLPLPTPKHQPPMDTLTLVWS